MSAIENLGLERCEFDDECDFCKSPGGGSYMRLIHNPEDCTEAEFYICGDCLHEAVRRYTKPVLKTEKNAQVWCQYVAGMIGAYLGEQVDGDRCKAIAGIIERRMWSLGRDAA